MKQNRRVTKAFSFFLSIFMLTALLSKDLTETQAVVADVPVQSDDSEQDEHETFVTEFSAEVVIPSHAFDFGSDVFVLPVPKIQILSEVNLVTLLLKSIYQNSYFDKLFELYIAINAP